MKILTLKGQIELLSGLHIGGGDDTMKIGGIDSQVIKDINTNKPYIPGSSLKGKMRSLLEWNNRLVGYGEGEVFNSKILEKVPEPDKKSAQNLLKIFGDKENKFGITRISVGDCVLSSKESEGLKLSEAKYENVINREKGTAEHPRQIERVPAGVKFDLVIRLKVFDEKEPYNDNENELKQMVESGLKLIENDYLGGSGSRGYGRVKFEWEWE